MSLRPERAWALEAAGRYWPRGAGAVAALPISESESAEPEPLPPRLVAIALPDWARELGVVGGLLVPEQCVGGVGLAWASVDWIGAMQWYLSGAAERAHESRHGPIHSYRLRLEGWPDALWDHAWVNRIALFLRRWSARKAGGTEEESCGPLPRAEIVMTHDVDAIHKTTAIRFKQSAFHAFNAARRLAGGQARRALHKAKQSLRFLTSADDYWCFERILALEDAHGLRSHFNVYAGPDGWRRGLRSLLIDPGYAAEDARLAACLRQIRARGWSVGLHQSFDAWADASVMARERERLERALGGPVTSCRQHWLRFSWSRTWAAQTAAGFRLDTTLGFNDRPGFRNGSALRFRPWDPAAQRPLAIESLPLLLMDSHLYDYADLSHGEAPAMLERWIRELAFVRGTATVLWHQQGMSRDYGWAPGFEALLPLIP